jgi:hypothetical protein
MSNDMQTIEAACKAARDARLVLTIRAEALQDEIASAQKRKLPGIRSAVEKVAQADALLLAALQESPLLFVKPKSVVFHGLQVGYKKGTGAIEIDDAGQVVKLIRKHFPERFEDLVKVKETPIKAAIRNLTGAELQKLGIKVHSAGEVVFITDATDSVDKLVKALLKGAEAEQEEEEAEA